MKHPCSPSTASFPPKIQRTQEFTAYLSTVQLAKTKSLFPRRNQLVVKRTFALEKESARWTSVQSLPQKNHSLLLRITTENPVEMSFKGRNCLDSELQILNFMKYNFHCTVHSDPLGRDDLFDAYVHSRSFQQLTSFMTEEQQVRQPPPDIFLRILHLYIFDDITKRAIRAQSVMIFLRPSLQASTSQTINRTSSINP
eukprot:scaffold3073_cov66-Cylindrotheca_fusiformis.AAC.1